MAEVGKNIRKIRKEKNLTQDELAERLHCTRQTISNYETGKSEPDISLLIELAGVLDVEIHELIYGPKRKENKKRRKNRAVTALAAAALLLAAVKILLPFAQEYSQKYFVIVPTYLLLYILRPFALVLLGWGIAEAGWAFAGIRIWEGRSKRTVRAIRVCYVMSAVVLAVFAVLALWMTADLTYLWLQSQRLLRSQGEFDSSTVPRLMPGWLQGKYIKVFTKAVVFNYFGGVFPFLGAALGFCRIEKEGNGD